MLSFRHPPDSDATDDRWEEYFRARAAEGGPPALNEFFSAGLPAPDTPISEVPLVALDIETTGLDARSHGIVSVGVVPFTLDRIPVGQGRYWVVKPRKVLRDESIVLHHITHSEVARAPDLETHLPELLGLMAGRVAVVHYRGIERPFLDDAVRVRWQTSWRFPVIDTMELEARKVREGFWPRLRRMFGGDPESIRLHESRQRYRLPYYRGHHALTDAIATAELLQAQIATHFSPQTPVGDLWS